MKYAYSIKNADNDALLELGTKDSLDEIQAAVEMYQKLGFNVKHFVVESELMIKIKMEDFISEMKRKIPDISNERLKELFIDAVEEL